jgi:hypothetical protein
VQESFREAGMRQNEHAGAVEAISVEGNAVAAIYRSQMVIGFTLEENGQFSCVGARKRSLQLLGLRQNWMYHLANTVPRSVAHFEGDIFVWGLMNGAL